MLPPDDPAELTPWILRFATANDAPDTLIEGVCDTLVRAGLPLWRASAATPTIDPMVRGASLNWGRGEGVVLVATQHGAEGEAVFQRSPIFALLAEKRSSARWRLDRGEGCDRFVLLDELRAQGGTDHVLHLIGFSAGTALTGVGLSITTDRPGGFEDHHVATFEAILPALGLAVYRMSLSRTAAETLSVYLGPMTGARVLAGEIRRGQGRTIAAAILLADLSGFTALTDREEPARVVGWLNDHLEAIGEAVTEHGGEILKFLGDGLLAVFPTESGDADPCQPCRQALLAARLALARNAAVNAARAAGPSLEVDVVLHHGDVVYGNIGTPRRLDFTTIGRAVNEASRIEKLCDSLGRHLLLSDSFAQRCGYDHLTPLGAFLLRGLDEPRPLWGLD